MGAGAPWQCSTRVPRKRHRLRHVPADPDQSARLPTITSPRDNPLTLSTARAARVQLRERHPHGRILVARDIEQQRAVARGVVCGERRPVPAARLADLRPPEVQQREAIADEPRCRESDRES